MIKSLICFLTVCSFFTISIAQDVEFDQDILTSKNIFFGELGAFEGSIFGLDILAGKNDLRFGVGDPIEILMILDDAGKLGIGLTPSPALYQLEVEGSIPQIGLLESSSSQGTFLSLLNTSNPGGTAWILNASGSSTGNGTLHFLAQGLATVSFDLSGNVGIGNQTPNDALDVVGDIDATGCIEIGDGASVLGGACVSDRRLKKNITDLEDQIDIINSLRPVRYDWKSDSPRNGLKDDIGLIAQEVEEVLPDMVVTDADGNMRVKYDLKLQMRMIKAMQEQQSMIENQQTQIEQLKHSISSLEAQIGRNAED